MKVRDITRQLSDPKIMVEIKYTSKDGGGTFGVFNQSELHYNDRLQSMTVKGLNVQYFNNTRLLIIYV